METYLIGIMSGNTQTGALQLSDRGLTPITFLQAGDQVVWEITKGALVNVAKIIGIHADQGSLNIFSSGPTSNFDGTTWTGILQSGEKPGTFENYTIVWEDTDGKQHSFDPKIQIQS